MFSHVFRVCPSMSIVLPVGFVGGFFLLQVAGRQWGYVWRRYVWAMANRGLHEVGLHQVFALIAGGVASNSWRCSSEKGEM
jgi:hypothetical protein